MAENLSFRLEDSKHGETTYNYYEILPATGLDKSFTYKSLVQLEQYEIVLVPFRNREILGIVIANKTAEVSYPVKEISRNFNLHLTFENYEFLEKFSDYNMIERGLALKMFLSPREAVMVENHLTFYEIANPENIKITANRRLVLEYLGQKTTATYAEIKEDLAISKNIINSLVNKGALAKFTQSSPLKYKSKPYHFKGVNLNHAQDKAYLELKEFAVENKFGVTLLNGVTGSGKTEIYLKLVADFLKKNDGQILILLPEIVLTDDFLQKFVERFGYEPDFFHSNVPPKRKKEIWHGVISGQSKIVVGARSALFLPFKKLNLIILDEEHDSAYKQEDMGSYQARDMAVLYAKICSIPIILSSATASLESKYNVKKTKYNEVEITTRFNQSDMPKISVIDMRKEILAKGNFVSDFLRSKIKEKLANREQVLIFLNKLGYAPLLICNDCGERVACKHCDVWLTWHKVKNKLVCHQCGYQIDKPTNCFKCNSENLVAFGPGVERIYEELQLLFPEAKMAIVTSASIQKAGQLEKIFKEIKEGEIDIIIGTQILVKGHNFPKLSLVGVVDADISNNQIENYRARELMFQTLQQISGRVGRFEKKGEVFLQSFSPEAKIFKFLAEYDYKNFADLEIENRIKAKAPPYFKLASIIISAKDKDRAEQYANKVRSMLTSIDNLEIMGPIRSEIFLLKNYYRYRIYLRTKQIGLIQAYLRHYLDVKNFNKDVRIKIDIDPQSFY